MLGMEVWNQKDPTQEAREFVKRHQLTYPVVVDGDGSMAKRYAPEGIPTNLVIGKDGTVRYLRAGFDEDDLRQAIDAALGGGTGAGSGNGAAPSPGGDPKERQAHAEHGGGASPAAEA